MLYAPFLPSWFLFFHSAGLAITHSHFLQPSVSLFRIYRTPVTVKALMWEFIYVLPTLFAFPYCFHRCSAPQRKSQQRRTISLLFSRTNILVIFSLLCARVHFSEANGGSRSSGHPVTMLHLLRLCLSVNFPACFSILYKGILYHFRAHLFNVLLTRRGLVRDVMISKGDL